MYAFGCIFIRNHLRNRVRRNSVPTQKASEQEFDQCKDVLKWDTLTNNGVKYKNFKPSHTNFKPRKSILVQSVNFFSVGSTQFINQ